MEKGKSKEKEFVPDYIGCDIEGEEISGYSIREQPDCITVIVKFFKESEKYSTISKMIALLDQHNFAKRVYIIDSNEFVREMKKYNIDDSKFDDFDQQIIAVELTDLKTGAFVPIKIVVFK